MLAPLTAGFSSRPWDPKDSGPRKRTNMSIQRTVDHQPPPLERSCFRCAAHVSDENSRCKKNRNTTTEWHKNHVGSVLGRCPKKPKRAVSNCLTVITKHLRISCVLKREPFALFDNTSTEETRNECNSAKCHTLEAHCVVSDVRVVCNVVVVGGTSMCMFVDRHVGTNTQGRPHVVQFRC